MKCRACTWCCHSFRTSRIHRIPTQSSTHKCCIFLFCLTHSRYRAVCHIPSCFGYFLNTIPRKECGVSLCVFLVNRTRLGKGWYYCGNFYKSPRQHTIGVQFLSILNIWHTLPYLLCLHYKQSRARDLPTSFFRFLGETGASTLYTLCLFGPSYSSYHPHNTLYCPKNAGFQPLLACLPFKLLDSCKALQHL